MSLPEPRPAWVAFASSLADEARQIARQWFRADPPVETKADHSPVTVADKKIEARLRARLSDRFPDHGVLGEEQPPVNPDAEWVWVIDPIDGTKAFMTGKPTFATLIALLWRGTPVIGVIEASGMRERWVGAQGQRTTLNDKPVSTRACHAMKDAALYATSPRMFEGEDEEAWLRLRDAAAYDLYGADAYQYGMLASGWCDLVCEADLKPFDFCAVVPVITGAGGVVTHWSGAPVTVHGDGRILAAGDPDRHREALALIAG